MSNSGSPTRGSSGDAPQSPAASIRLSRRESLEFVEQVASLAGEDVALAPGLRVAAKEFPPGRLASAMQATADKCETGLNLADAMQAAGVQAPPHIHALLGSASTSGQLATVVNEFLRSEARNEDLRRRVWPALIYPLILIALTAAWWFFISEAVIKDFRELFIDFDSELPEQTVRLFVIVDYGPKVAMALGVFALLVLLVLYLTGGKARVVGALYLVPGVGVLLRYADLAEYANMLSVLLGQAMPLPQALEVAAQGVRGAPVAAGSRRLAEKILAGNSLAASFTSTWPFLPMFGAVAGWGEKHSALADSLRAVGTYYEQRQLIQGHQLRAILPPLVFLFIAAVIQFVVVGLFMPLIKLISDLS